MNISISVFTARDYEKAIALWKSCEGIGLSGADSRSNIESFLCRNPNTNLVAYDGELMVGAVLCGSDGRRGYIYHLAIHPKYRNQNIGRMLITRCTQSLRAMGTQKCHLFIFNQNNNGKDFWKKMGWYYRDDINVFSKDLI